MRYILYLHYFFVVGLSFATIYSIYINLYNYALISVVLLIMDVRWIFKYYRKKQLHKKTKQNWYE